MRSRGRPDVLQVPTSALFRQDDGWAVFVVNGRPGRGAPVALGHRGALETEVASGLAPDESVIVHPGASVHAGARVMSR